MEFFLHNTMRGYTRTIISYYCFICLELQWLWYDIMILDLKLDLKEIMYDK